jgi:pimeloyl-ACP methyl ester carboxylesterase
VSAFGLVHAHFATEDGADISYRIRRGRDPLVLIHGLGCDASMWDGVVAALPSDLGLVIPELRGHGASTLGWRLPSVDLWADDVLRLLREKSLEGPAIAGLSLGGYTALGIAAAHPGFARAFAFISTSAAPDDEAGRLRRATGIATIRREGWRRFAAAFIPSLLNAAGPQFPAHSKHLQTMFEHAGDSGLPPTLMALAARPDRRELLPSIGVPSIVIVGAVDTLTPPEKARELAGGLAAAQLHVLDNVAHMSAMEASAEVADLLGML